MRTKALMSILVTALIGFFFLNGLCWAQTPFANSIKWGNAVEGVQLSVGLSNAVLTAGTKVILLAEIRNSSTNVAKVIISDPLVNDFTVYLANAKKSYTIAEPSTSISVSCPPIDIHNGEIRKWDVILTIGEDVQPGDYTIKATRSFEMLGSDFQLTSNFLKVRVK